MKLKMEFELCKGKTKCKECGEIMNKGEIRGVYGEGWFNDPIRYYCLKCSKKGDINISSLIKTHKQKIKEHTKKIKELKKLKKRI